jgi:hypothetical protein
MLTYNVFRARGRDVLCAVPEDRPVPRFVSGDPWEFAGRIEEDAINLPRAAKVAVAFNGFYIFHPFEGPKPKKAEIAAPSAASLRTQQGTEWGLAN